MGDVDDRWYRKDKDTGEDVPTARHGKGLRYAARYRDPAGKQKSKSFKLVGPARAFLASVETDKNKGDYVDHRAGRVRLHEHIETWLASQATNISSRHQTAIRVRKHIVPYLGDHELRSITPSVVQQWISGRRGLVADTYLRTLSGTLSTILQAAVDEGLIGKNPFAAASVKAPARQSRHVVPWPTAWVSGIRDALPLIYQETVTAAAGLGLRQGEVLGLAWEDIDTVRAVVHVRRQLKMLDGVLFYALPKGAKTRDVPLPASVATRLQGHRGRVPDNGVVLPWEEPTGKPVEAALLFRTPSGGAVTRHNFTTYTWPQARKAAGIPAGRENGMHACRHFFASAVLAGGASIRDLAEWLGHDDPGFTLRVYSHLMPDSAERMRTAIDAILTPASEPAPPLA